MELIILMLVNIELRVIFITPVAVLGFENWVGQMGVKIEYG